MAKPGANRSRVWVTLLLLLTALVQFFPIFYLVCMSMKVGGEAIQYPPRILPQRLDLANYFMAFDMAPLWRFLVNSIIVASVITIFQVLTSILAAFALARLEFRGKRWALLFIVATMMVPGEVTIIPNYFTLAYFDWINT